MFRTFVLLVAITSTTSVAIAQKSQPLDVSKMPEGVNLYRIFPEKKRRLLVTVYAQHLKEIPSQIEAAKKAIRTAKGKDKKEEAEQELERRKEYAEAIKTNDPPYLGLSLNSWTAGSETNHEVKWEIGAVGYSVTPVKVLSVINASTAIVKRETEGGDQILYAKGWDTKEWTDEDSIKLRGTLWVSDTTSYGAVSGAKKTVPLIEPFDWDRYKKAREKEAE